MLSAASILQAREKSGQTIDGVVYTDGKMLPPTLIFVLGLAQFPPGRWWHYTVPFEVKNVSDIEVNLM
jgi:hypothetical protein